MQIDWFTLLAEIVNFVILVYLLKRFLYDRVIEIADRREAEISRRYKEAAEKQEEAEQEARQFRRRKRALREEQEEMLEGAREEAEERRKELLESARREVERRQQDWEEALQRGQENFLRSLQERAGHQVYAVARRALADLANRDLESQVVDVFLRRLEEMDDEEASALRSTLERDEKPTAAVYSAFEMTDETHAAISEALRKQLGKDVSVRYRRNEDLVCGVALRVNDHKITWNIDDYLDQLEAEIVEALRREAELHGVEVGAGEE